MNGNTNDQELQNELRARIEKAQQGDEAAFNALLEQYAPLILAAAARAVANLGAEHYDDLRQEASIAFCRAVHIYAPEKGNFGAFAKTVIKNRLLDFSRSLVNHVPADPIDEAVTESAGGDDPAAAVLEREAVKALSDLIRTILSPFEAEVCRLLAQQHTCREIADLLGKDLHSIENAVYRIRRKLGEARGTRD